MHRWGRKVAPKLQFEIVEVCQAVDDSMRPDAQLFKRQVVSVDPDGFIAKVGGSCDVPRIGRKEDENGKLRRFSKKSGEFI